LTCGDLSKSMAPRSEEGNALKEGAVSNETPNKAHHAPATAAYQTMQTLSRRSVGVRVLPFDKADNLMDASFACIRLRKLNEADRMLRLAIDHLRERSDIDPAMAAQWKSMMADPGKSADELLAVAENELKKLEASKGLPRGKPAAPKQKKEKTGGCFSTNSKESSPKKVVVNVDLEEEDSLKAPGAAGWRKAVIGRATTGPEVVMYTKENGDPVFQPTIEGEHEMSAGVPSMGNAGIFDDSEAMREAAPQRLSINKANQSREEAKAREMEERIAAEGKSATWEARDKPSELESGKRRGYPQVPPMRLPDVPPQEDSSSNRTPASSTRSKATPRHGLLRSSRGNKTSSPRPATPQKTPVAPTSAAPADSMAATSLPTMGSELDPFALQPPPSAKQAERANTGEDLDDTGAKREEVPSAPIGSRVCDPRACDQNMCTIS